MQKSAQRESTSRQHNSHTIERALDVYHYIVKYKLKRQGATPTYDSIGEALGIASKSQVAVMIRILEELELVERLSKYDLKVKGITIGYIRPYNLDTIDPRQMTFL